MKLKFSSLILCLLVCLSMSCGPSEEEQYRQKLIGDINPGLTEAQAKLATIESLSHATPPSVAGEIPKGMMVYASHDTEAGRWRSAPQKKNTIMQVANGSLTTLNAALSHRSQTDGFIQAIKANLSKPVSDTSSQIDLVDMKSDVEALLALRYVVLVTITNEVRPQVISPTQYTVGSLASQVSIYDVTSKSWVTSFPFNIASNDEMKYNFGGYNQDYKGNDQQKMQQQVMGDLVIKFESELVKVLTK